MVSFLRPNSRIATHQLFSKGELLPFQDSISRQSILHALNTPEIYERDSSPDCVYVMDKLDCLLVLAA